MRWRIAPPSLPGSTNDEDSTWERSLDEQQMGSRWSLKSMTFEIDAGQLIC